MKAGAKAPAFSLSWSASGREMRIARFYAQCYCRKCEEQGRRFEMKDYTPNDAQKSLKNTEKLGVLEGWRALRPSVGVRYLIRSSRPKY